MSKRDAARVSQSLVCAYEDAMGVVYAACFAALRPGGLLVTVAIKDVIDERPRLVAELASVESELREANRSASAPHFS